MLGQSRKTALSRDDAEKIAIRVLSYLASDTDLLSRFMNLSGMEPDDIAKNASTSAFQVALLDYLMADETLLLTFCGNENIDPALIAPAHHILGG